MEAVEQEAVAQTTTRPTLREHVVALFDSIPLPTEASWKYAQVETQRTQFCSMIEKALLDGSELITWKTMIHPSIKAALVSHDFRIYMSSKSTCDAPPFFIAFPMRNRTDLEQEYWQPLK
jgi:hypothetical protein